MKRAVDSKKKDRKSLDAVAIKCEKGAEKVLLCWELKIGLDTFFIH